MFEYKIHRVQYNDMEQGHSEYFYTQIIVMISPYRQRLMTRYKSLQCQETFFQDFVEKNEKIISSI